MQIIAYQPEHLTGLYQIYQQTVAPVPHCQFLPSIQYIGHALAQAEAAGSRILVAIDQGHVYGIATLRPVAQDEHGVPFLEITGLFTPDEAIANMLLEYCLTQADQAEKIVVFPAERGHCPLVDYNAGWNGLSDQLRPIARVLARHRFAPTNRELSLECSEPHFPPPALPVPHGIRILEGSDQGYLAVRAMVDDQEVGICGFSILSRYTDHPQASRYGYIEWLYVAEAVRRRGIARYLLTLAMQRLAEQGCQVCWITTGSDNFSAQPLYLSLGFEILDTSSSWEKAIRQTDGQQFQKL